MSPKLCILCCNHFHQELDGAIKAEGWPDVVVASFPSHCGRPPIQWNELLALLPEKCSHMIVQGGVCIADLPPPPVSRPVARVLPYDNCFQMVVTPDLVADSLAANGYLMTPGWLQHWSAHLASLGFTPEQSGPFLREFANQLVLFDTKTAPDSKERLEKLSNLTKLPAKQITIGLDHTRLLLAKLVYEWRLANRIDDERIMRNRHNSELANYALAMELLAHLATLQEEKAVIDSIKDLFHQLFAPGVCDYLPLEHGKLVHGPEISATLLESIQQTQDPWILTPSGQGFVLRIMLGSQLFGYILVDQLAFPEYRERYLNMAISMAGILSLVIQNTRRYKRLLEAEKMVTLGVLSRGVAHNFNNLLGVILGNAELAQLGIGNTEETMGNIVAAVVRGRDMISQLLAYSDHASSGNHRFRLSSVLHEVVATINTQCPPTIQLTSSIMAEDNEVFGNASQIQQVLINLATNALQALERQRGTIHITLAPATLTTEELLNYSLAPGNYLEITVQDNGPGMDSEVKKQIFQPFFTTREPGKGTGLGLAFAYGVIRNNLGVLLCESKPGAGAMFRIFYPTRNQ